MAVRSAQSGRMLSGRNRMSMMVDNGPGMPRTPDFSTGFERFSAPVRPEVMRRNMERARDLRAARPGGRAPVPPGAPPPIPGAAQPMPGQFPGAMPPMPGQLPGAAGGNPLLTQLPQGAFPGQLGQMGGPVYGQPAPGTVMPAAAPPPPPPPPTEGDGMDLGEIQEDVGVPETSWSSETGKTQAAEDMQNKWNELTDPSQMGGDPQVWEDMKSEAYGQIDANFQQASYNLARQMASRGMGSSGLWGSQAQGLEVAKNQAKMSALKQINMDRLTAQLEDKKTLLASIGQMFPAEMQGAVQSYLATLEGQKELNTMFMWGVDDMRAAMLDESWDDMPMEAKLWFTSGDLETANTGQFKTNLLEYLNKTVGYATIHNWDIDKNGYVKVTYRDSMGQVQYKLIPYTDI